MQHIRRKRILKRALEEHAVVSSKRFQNPLQGSCRLPSVHDTKQQQLKEIRKLRQLLSINRRQRVRDNNSATPYLNCTYLLTTFSITYSTVCVSNLHTLRLFISDTEWHADLR